MRALGTKFFGQDSAVCLIDTKEREIFAISTDRISRIKKDNFDIGAIFEEYPERFKTSLDVVSFSFSDFSGADALLETKGTSYYWLNFQQRLRAITRPKYRSDLSKSRSLTEKVKLWLRMIGKPSLFWFWMLREYYWKKYLNNQLRDNFHFSKIDQYLRERLRHYRVGFDKLKYHDHHLCHAYSAYFMSPFCDSSETIVFTLDEHGDQSFSKVFKCRNGVISEFRSSKTEKFKKDGRFHVTSIADIYSNFTEAMGLIRSTDEGKVEALAAYGEVDADLLEKLNSCVFIENLQFKFRVGEFSQFSDISYLKNVKTKIGEKNFCATAQHWLEKTVVEYLNQLHMATKASRLCLAGGVTANVIMNYKIFEETPFEEIYVAPPMGDEGTALGSALISIVEKGADISWLQRYEMPYFGPSFSESQVRSALAAFESDIVVNKIDRDWPLVAAERIAKDQVIAIFHGRMEFGPRALGNRSILASPSSARTRERINSFVKRRPFYQPFCPSVLEEERERLYERSFSHKHMATAFMLKREFRDQLPSAIHVDGTSRPQFVSERDNPSYFHLIRHLKKLTSFGVVINTSFNLHGRPVVHSPSDAIRDFLDCNLDALYLEGFEIVRSGVRCD